MAPTALTMPPRRTEFDLVDKDHLLITAYNIEPESAETKAVETDYRRVVEK